MAIPKATRPNPKLAADRDWYRGVLACLSILRHSRATAVVRLRNRIITEIGRADLLERARLDGTTQWAGLDTLTRSKPKPKRRRG